MHLFPNYSFDHVSQIPCRPPLCPLRSGVIGWDLPGYLGKDVPSSSHAFFSLPRIMCSSLWNLHAQGLFWHCPILSKFDSQKTLWVFVTSLHPGLPIQGHPFWSTLEKFTDDFVGELVGVEGFPCTAECQQLSTFADIQSSLALTATKDLFLLFFSYLVYKCWPFSSRLLEFTPLSLLFKSKN